MKQDQVETAIEHFNAGRLHSAEVCCRELLERVPDCADAWHLLGMIADAAGSSGDAIMYIRQALTLAPDRPEFLNNLATVHEQRLEWNHAEQCLQEALRLRPNYAIAHNNLGEVMKDLGRVGRAIECYRSALRYAPDSRRAASNLLMALNYDPDIDAKALKNEHRLWGSRIENGSVLLPPIKCAADPHRPLQIGYISPDFRKHAVSRFFEPILASHDPHWFSVYLYSQSPAADSVAQRLKSLARAWRPIFRVNSADVASQIRADQIDILIDLSGHTRDNRLDVLACRPAPVQVTYLGYPNTSGLSRIDYRISDSFLDPPQLESSSTEEIFRLPNHAYCFQPPESVPEIMPPPHLRNGYFTFGSHHPPIKINDRVLDAWRQVLEAVPNSRLLMFRNSLNEELQNELRSRCESRGLPVHRIEMRSPTADEASYLPLYNEIDLVLDTFPFNGHTMTLEALWMGVPVVTLHGDRPSCRLAASVLQAIGLTDFIAQTPEEYVNIAKRCATSPNRCVQLRQQLRYLVRNHLCDGRAFTPRLEWAYRWMWQRWCAAQK